jgi:hypothetical protein
MQRGNQRPGNVWLSLLVVGLCFWNILLFALGSRHCVFPLIGQSALVETVFRNRLLALTFSSRPEVSPTCVGPGRFRHLTILLSSCRQIARY